MTVDWDGKIRWIRRRHPRWHGSSSCATSSISPSPTTPMPTARRRDARAWLAQPEPFPERRDRLPVRRRPGMGERRWRREDTGVLIDDRPGRGRPPAALRGARRLRRFVDGLVDGSIGFGGEESAGASFLRRDGTVWTTDKDGIIADLLACELTARTGQDPVWRTASSRSDPGRPSTSESIPPRHRRRRRRSADWSASDVTPRSSPANRSARS